MAVESATYISQLNPSFPDGAENVSDGDNHIRLTKNVLQNQFTSLGTAAVTKTAAELNSVTDRSLRAGDTYTGTHDFDGATAVLVPTVANGDSSTNAASTAFLMAAIGGVNANGSLVAVEYSGTTASPAVGQHAICTNAAAVAVTLPASPVLGNRVKVTFGNSVYFGNTVDPGAEKIRGTAGAHTANALGASAEFVYSGSSLGWVY